MAQKIVAVDFDGTCVTHEYPRVGRDIGAAPVLKELAARGHLLILHTVRSGSALRDAVKWFDKNDIPLYGMNSNPNNPTDSPKPYANIYIDDAALGCPLTSDLSDVNGRPYCDWVAISSELARKGYFD